MTLGYCILHANQIDIALTGMSEDTVAADEGIDLGLGALALHQPEKFFTDYLDGVGLQARAVLARIEAAFASGGGVLADLQRWIDALGQARFDELKLTPWVDRLADLFAALEPVALAGKLDAVLERLAIALPELNGGGLLDRTLTIALGGLDVLERRRLAGTDDLAGHRAFRMARIVRYWLADAVAGLRRQLADFDLIATMRKALRGMVGDLTSPGPGFLRGLGERVKLKLRPFAVALDALLTVHVSVRVDASIEALPAAGELWLDDNLTTPHDRKHPLWWIDLAAGIHAFGFTVVDVQRFNPFYAPRAGDALLSVLNLAWQTVRTVVRAIRPEFLRTNHSTTPGAFWFGELGDFCVQLLLIFLGSMHEAAHAGSNWVMSFACRLARWFTFTLQPRMPYIFARAIVYLRAWRKQGWISEHVVAVGETIETIAAKAGVEPARLRVWNRIAAGKQPAVGATLVLPAETDTPGRKRAPLSFIRHIWNAWMWMWFVAAINGMAQGWDDLQVDKLGDTRFSKVGVWLGPVIGVLAAIFLPMAIGGGFTGFEYEIDWATFTALVGMMLLLVGVIAGSMYSTNATKDKWGWMLLVGAVVLCALFVPVLVLWLLEKPAVKTAGGFLYVWGLVAGVVVFGLVTTILWWIYIDDGRDKQGKFTGLDAETSPYKLPWPSDQAWVCGQGFHGVFSHFMRDNDGNHYGYDFLEAKDKPALATRGGLVTTIRQSNPYGSPEQNDIAIQHLDWAKGHDPGTDLERVQTYTHYIHIGPQRARIDIDQFVFQGQNVVDIDSTGMSAQQHLHLGAAHFGDSRWAGRAPTGRNTVIRSISSGEVANWAADTYFRSSSRPLIFADAALRRDRTNPILRWIPGHIHHPGRPLAQCIYVSDNERKPGAARPMVLITIPATPEGPATIHTHRLEIDVAALPLDGRLSTSTLELWTTVDAGHRHRVVLDAAQVEALLRHDLPAGWRSEAAMAAPLAHDHAFAAETWAGSTAPPPIAGVNQPARVDSPIAQVGLTAPPPAQLLARKPAPYDLLGQRLIVRRDGRGTDFYHFAGDRAALLGDLTIDRAPRPGDVLDVQVGAPVVNVAATGARASLRAGVAELDAALNASDVVVRAVPVLMLETRERGHEAALTVVTASGAGRSFGDPVAGPIVARGSGALARRTIGRADLRSLLLAACNQAPAMAAPLAADVVAAAVAGATDLRIAGNAVVADGSPRVRRVFTGRYDPAAQKLTGRGPLTLGAGRIELTWGTPGARLDVPIAGTPAALELDPASAGLTPELLPLGKLSVTVGTSEVALRLASGLAFADIPALLMREVDGLRAWVEAGKLRLETVDVGPGVQLEVHRQLVDFEFKASATGEAPKLAGGASIADSALLTRIELERAITDAARRGEDATKRAAAIAANTAVAVEVEWKDDRLRIFVAAPATIELLAGDSSQALLRVIGHESITGAAPALLRSPDGSELLSRPLPVQPLELPPGWLDLRVGADVRRVHLDAEPARIDLAPIVAWPGGDPGPAATATLELEIGSDKVSVDLSGRTSLVDIAAAITAADDRLLVRIGHRVAIEARHPGSIAITLPDSAGRSALGFTGAAALSAAGLGPAVDLHAVATGPEVLAARYDAPGTPGAGYMTAVTATEQIELTAGGTNLLGVTLLAGGSDPFGLVATASATVTGGVVTATPLPRRALHYRVDLFAANGTTLLARTFVQVGASPAMLRASGPPGVLALALSPATRLKIRVTWPGVGGSRQRESTLDLGWASELLRESGRMGDAAFEAELHRRVVDQIQREVPLVEAWLVGRGGAPTRLHLQTHGAGTGWQLRLTGKDAIVALGFAPERLGGANKDELEALGGGDVVDAERTEAAEISQVFTAAAGRMTWAPLGAAAVPPPSIDFPFARATRYVAGARSSALLLRLRAAPGGCMSHIEPLAGHESFDFDRSLERAPAANAAVVIPTGPDIKLVAAAALWIEFDGDPVAVPPVAPHRVAIQLPIGTYTRRALAERVHAAIFAIGAGGATRGAGMAGRHLDDSIVVETLTPGLAGSVLLPASGSDATLVTALGLDLAQPKTARGWPGAGQLEDCENFRTGATLRPAGVVALQSAYMPVRGLRAKIAASPTADVVWRFHGDAPTTAGVFSSPTLKLQSGWSAAKLVAELNTTLAAAVDATGTPGSLGLARLGVDGSVQIEAVAGGMLVLEVQPVGGTLGPLGSSQPDGIGERRDITPDPGLDLRATDTLRTYRLVYDRGGDATVADGLRFVDAGWLRPPTDGRWGTTRDHDTYEPIDVPSWPHGRYLLAARAEAAMHDYGKDGEMIVSAGEATVGGEKVAFVHIARYWLSLTCLTQWNHSEFWVAAGSPSPWGGRPAALAHDPLCAGVRRLGTEWLIDWRV